MKKLIVTLLLAIVSSYPLIAQTENYDSVNDAKIERIRKKVQNFFLQQNKRFSNILKGVNEEYILYSTPNYSEGGFLFWDIYHLDDQLKPKYDYEKQSCYEKNIVIPEQIVNYSNFLLNRTNGNWCENKFGYKNLNQGDDLGIMFIFSPKNIPDSLSVLKIRELLVSNYENETKEKKRLIDLAFLQSKYYRMAEGLNERFIRVVIKY